MLQQYLEALSCPSSVLANCVRIFMQKVLSKLGPSSLIFSFSSVLHLHTMLVLPFIFLTKELDKYDARRISAHYMPLQKGCFGCCAVDRHISVTLIGLVSTPLVPYVKKKNNGDKFYHRKSMRVADEKLIINKVGP